MIAILALIIGVMGHAVADSAPEAMTSASVQRAAKKAQRKAAIALRRANKALKLARSTSKQQGPTGDPGPAGPPGEDAAALFAFVRDTGGANAAGLEYGSGALKVADPEGSTGSYILTFDRNLEGCVGLANAGLGNPVEGGTLTAPSEIVVNLHQSDPSTLQVSLSSGDGSFMVGVLC